ncbi:MAG: hypothetical protein ACREJ0_26460 [Geminicoccaceae bacterium]
MSTAGLPVAGASDRRVAVIDSGSNLVRMVAFDLRQGMPPAR